MGALVRVLATPQGSPEFLQIRPGIELALERILLQHERKISIDDIQEDYNVLKNLITLIRLEKQNTSPHLTQHLVTATLTNCISKLLDIFGCYIRQEMRCVESSEIINADASDESIADEQTMKRSKLESSKEDRQTNKIYNEQIHLLANLLNTLEIGGIDSMLSMVDVIKLSQLTVKYFFWSLIEKCKYNNLKKK